MQHSIASSDTLVRPWRTATLVVSAVAAVELVLLIVASAFLFTHSFGHGSSAGSKKKAAHARAAAHRPARPLKLPKPAPVGAPKLARGQTTVMVLNGNGRSGAAGSEADLVRARGYRVGHVGNATQADYPRSMVMYRPGFHAEGVRLGRDLGVRLVTPLDGLRPRDLGGAQVLVVVGG